MNPIHINTDRIKIDEMKIINTKNLKYEGNNYTLLNYDPNFICDDDIMKGAYNSILINSNNIILSVGQCKTVQIDTFKRLTENNNDMAITVEPLIEGISMNLFYDTYNKKWEFCTKNSIGANYSYYKTKDDKYLTFKEMFLDAIQLSKNTDINEWEVLKNVKVNYCMQFILMHPQHHNVFMVEKPKLYFIGSTIIHHENIFNNIYYMNRTENEVFFNEIFFNCGKIDMTPSSIITTKVDSNLLIEEANKDDPQSTRIGLIYTDVKTNLKCTIINTKYKELQDIRGTNPNIMFQYICLRKTDKIKDFLKYFPNYKDEFWKFKTIYDNLIKNIHNSYVNYFIKKNKHIVVEKQIFYHIQQIHNNIYLPSISETKIIIKKNIVAEYIFSLEPACVFHLLNKYKDN